VLGCLGHSIIAITLDLCSHLSEGIEADTAAKIGDRKVQ